MARHRSPGGRRPHQPSPSVVGPLVGPTTATDAGRGGFRSHSTPLRRGATAIAVAGGTLSLVGAGVPMVVQSAHDANAAQPQPYRAAAALRAAPATVEPVVEPAAESVAAPVAEPLVAPTVEPVAWTPEPDATDGASLVKAVQMVEQQIALAEADRVAAEQRVAQEKAQEKKTTDPDDEDEEYAGSSGGATGSPDCGVDTSELGKVKKHVLSGAEFLGCLFGEPTMFGVAGRGGSASDHPGGLAVDFMVDRATGDRLAECALRNQDALGIKYVIWEQRINHGSGWKAMEDRGGVTANHFDHVHVSFDSGAGSGDLSGC